MISCANRKLPALNSHTWRGLGVLLDLGYASFKLLRDCHEHDVRFVIRLKDSWKPRVQHVARGKLS